MTGKPEIAVFWESWFYGVHEYETFSSALNFHYLKTILRLFLFLTSIYAQRKNNRNGNVLLLLISFCHCEYIHMNHCIASVDNRKNSRRN